ncbi:glycosyltransferase family 4 protein [Pseudoruegeria sp. SK021]|uniref:glycosyltransferase family 4 protein n=1 Tax=Pseudoruegeria sp. SK021 TaxID=1933035 RepID=UPI000A234172|nr:glycosyltransferase family 4 protein [Pseudoruegeria sp. SK021]OSP54100.1 glycosyltransferase WbuB [Pseudoruegeria sp. SK021]
MPRLGAVRADKPLSGRKVLIIVENLPLPFDRRVWHESRTLTAAGAQVAVICPTGKGYEAPYEEIDGVHIYRHKLPLDAKGASGYLLEYGAALFHETRLAWKILFKHGFDTVQGCNPPDLIFLVAWPFKLMGKRYIFDHHDINPELYEAKFNKRGFFWKLMVLFEKLNFWSANVVISTNQSYRQIAMERGGKKSEDIFVVRSGPDLNRLHVMPPNPAWKKGREAMVGYVGVMGDQEGIDLLLEAAREIVFDRGRDLQFVLVGGGPALDDLQVMAKDLGLEDYVTFTGRAPDTELFEVMSSADVCVNPDRVNPMNDKSTMNKILEYMAFSKPIVQFEVTEGRYSAQEASLYAEPNNTTDMADKILSLIDDPERSAEMGRIGRARVESELSWDYQVDTLIAAYQRAKG